ncbi:protein phosphatase 1 regulatory subunit 15A [Numida meleagris]|uniref:protein phosphatase 1 regulatory subunit 15A n=1 Tax=Numida meleagris TaxID=8996 RepID=UPI000B3E0F2B|nr:protein phosphatase 1 regulatory subunit 15A [Numida meleagris]
MAPPCTPLMAAEDPLRPPLLHALFYRPEPDEDDDDEQGWDGDSPGTPPTDGDPPKIEESPKAEEPVSSEDRGTKKVRFNLQVQVFLLQPPPDPDARRGPWETMARDRLRFARRRALLRPVLDPVLQPAHRERVWERLQRGESLRDPPRTPLLEEPPQEPPG